ncbi:MAG: hypothetical protein ISS81_08915 [Candidatus Marinimicrobia bacterium]|nr:hypothetical protein [Candidatus Neomarinimicrobiota bacterium]
MKTEQSQTVRIIPKQVSGLTGISTAGAQKVKIALLTMEINMINIFRNKIIPCHIMKRTGCNINSDQAKIYFEMKIPTLTGKIIAHIIGYPRYCV